ncbi:prolyl 4-hydroxylase subunit alpha-2-like [Ptychodera flava]|uniref:prolyl 4-hydroxylase subunit alpha-2-like n=1 Tax=Ptychodera flava TaxID=63121 RepID=UPI00396AA044
MSTFSGTLRFLLPSCLAIILGCVCNAEDAHTASEHQQAFRSIEKLRTLASLEGHLMWALDHYVRTAKTIIARGELLSQNSLMYPLITRENLAVLDSILYDVRPTAMSISANIDKHVTNPVLAFQLLHRYVILWGVHVKNRIQCDVGEDFLQLFSTTERLIAPEVDLRGACHAIFRMQYIYRVSTRDFSMGSLPGTDRETLPSHMGVEDCFVLGKEAYLLNDTYMCVTWMEESLRRLNAGYPVRPWHDVTLTRIYEFIAYCHYLGGNIHKAVMYTKRILMIDPDNGSGLSNIALFTHLETMSNVTAVQEPDYPVEGKACDMKCATGYEKYCRGELPKQTADVQRHLKCYYVNDHPLLRIQPIGVEMLNTNNPRALVFKNFLSDRECDIIKNKAKPLLHKSNVLWDDTQPFRDTRVSNTAWLYENDDPEPYLMTIAKRIGAVTGLNVETAEPFQVLNYGMGGMYEPHHDYAFNVDVLEYRLATFLMYLSDVNWGGGTVFTLLGRRALPNKGDALFWYNMKRSGEFIPNSLHAGCPVLLGEKWIVNKWFSYLGQEEHFKCGLSPDAPE